MADERPLLLAAAAIRLRKRPGRPRKVTVPESNAGTVRAQASMRARMNAGDNERGLVAPASRQNDATPVAPRLLDVEKAAAYLGISSWTLRELDVPRVRIPGPGGRGVRRLLFDVRVLDQLIERWRQAQ